MRNPTAATVCLGPPGARLQLSPGRWSEPIALRPKGTPHSDNDIDHPSVSNLLTRSASPDGLGGPVLVPQNGRAPDGA